MISVREYPKWGPRSTFQGLKQGLIHIQLPSILIPTEGQKERIQNGHRFPGNMLKCNPTPGWLTANYDGQNSLTYWTWSDLHTKTQNILLALELKQKQNTDNGKARRWWSSIWMRGTRTTKQDHFPKAPANFHLATLLHCHLGSNRKGFSFSSWPWTFIQRATAPLLSFGDCLEQTGKLFRFSERNSVHTSVYKHGESVTKGIVRCHLLRLEDSLKPTTSLPE